MEETEKIDASGQIRDKLRSFSPNFFAEALALADNSRYNKSNALIMKSYKEVLYGYLK